jgi:RimJ/RimL family protein N-acetyltransferase
MGGESRAFFNRRNYNRKRTIDYCLGKSKYSRYYGAFIGDTLGGVVFLLESDTGIPELGLALRDDLQGKGLGHELTRFGIEEAKSLGAGGVYLTTHVANVRAQALYESEGFGLVGTAKDGTELAYLLRFKKKTN